MVMFNDFRGKFFMCPVDNATLEFNYSYLNVGKHFSLFGHSAPELSEHTALYIMFLIWSVFYRGIHRQELSGPWSPCAAKHYQTVCSTLMRGGLWTLDRGLWKHFSAEPFIALSKPQHSQNQRKLENLLFYNCERYQAQAKHDSFQGLMRERGERERMRTFDSFFNLYYKKVKNVKEIPVKSNQLKAQHST